MVKKERRNRPHRKVAAAVLIVVEGYTEKAFLAHLKSVYDERDSGTHVTVRNARGGSAEDVVRHAHSLLAAGGYDRCFLVMDCDRCRNTDCDQSRAGNKAIWKELESFRHECIGSRPCIEGTLLKILDIKSSDDSQECKEAFHKHVIPENKKRLSESYAKSFPKSVLDKARRRVAELDRLIRIFQPDR
jgi:hypothetical protein